MTQKISIALAGNPNCGKTTLFNALTGSHQTVGNWPGVTVEKKSGSFTVNDQQITLVDLPGAYSLQPCDALPAKTSASLENTSSQANLLSS